MHRKGTHIDITRLWESSLAGGLFPETAEECCRQTKGLMDGRMALRPDPLRELEPILLVI